MNFVKEHFIYLLYIIAIFIDIIFLLKNDVKKSKILSLSLLIFFTIIMGIRYDVGIDFKNYEYYFNNNTYLLSIKEFFWIALNKLIYYLNGSFTIVSFISLLITNCFIYLGLKKRFVSDIDISMAIILFLCNYAIIFLNIIRQGIAISIVFYAISYLYSEDYLNYFLFCIFATLFHSSAIICFLIPILTLMGNLVKKIPFNIVLFFILFSYLLVYFNLPSILFNYLARFIPSYAKYVDSIFVSVQGGSILSLGVLVNAFICLILFKLNNHNEDTNLYLDKILYLIGVTLNIFSISSFLIDRIGLYFSVCSVVAIPVFLKYIDINAFYKKAYLKKMIICFVLIFNMLYCTKTVIFSDAQLNLEYHTFFDKSS